MAVYSVADAERRGLWLLAGGLAAGGLAVWFAGPKGAWLAVAGAALVLALAAFGARRRRKEAAHSPPVNGANLMLLPGPAREIFERLPDPFLLLDASGRVIFANTAMNSVLGMDAQKKHVSAVLRTPAVLQAVERTAATGEPASVEFSFHVPVERNFQAHVMRTGHTPHITALAASTISPP